jgi:lactate permease
MWNQVYDPFNNWIFSTLCAALPVVTLLVLIASNKVKAHIAAIVALIVANLVAICSQSGPRCWCAACRSPCRNS